MTSHRARFLSIGITAAVLAATLAACSSSSSSSGGNTKSPILIGAALSLTGANSVDGQAFQKGYELWAKDVNAKGGLLGRKVQLVIKNDASSVTQVISDYQTLINVDHVNLLFGPFSTTLTIPSLQVAHRYGYALVEGAGGAPSVFATRLPDVFDVSLPVNEAMLPFITWITSLPPSQRPKTAAFPCVSDLFTEFQIQYAQQQLSKAGISTVYSKVFPAEPTQYKGIADQVAASKAQVVVLGSVDVPTVAAFTQAFIQQHYTPKAIIATSGPDQGSAFARAVGTGNNDGFMVPNPWYAGSANPLNRAMVAEYAAQYNVPAAGVPADAAEAYSVGEVMAQAVEGTHGIDNTKIIAYLHSHTMSSVQGPVTFNAVGENTQSLAFVFQWQGSNFVQVLPVGSAGSVPIEFPKKPWGK